MCKYCVNNDEFILFQDRKGMKIFINGARGTLLVQRPYCPANSGCKLRGIPGKVEFLLAYCPACGRKFR